MELLAQLPPPPPEPPVCKAAAFPPTGAEFAWHWHELACWKQRCALYRGLAVAAAAFSIGDDDAKVDATGALSSLTPGRLGLNWDQERDFSKLVHQCHQCTLYKRRRLLTASLPAGYVAVAEMM